MPNLKRNFAPYPVRYKSSLYTGSIASMDGDGHQLIQPQSGDRSPYLWDGDPTL